MSLRQGEQGLQIATAFPLGSGNFVLSPRLRPISRYTDRRGTSSIDVLPPAGPISNASVATTFTKADRLRSR